MAWYRHLPDCLDVPSRHEARWSWLTGQESASGHRRPARWSMSAPFERRHVQRPTRAQPRRHQLLDLRGRRAWKAARHASLGRDRGRRDRTGDNPRSVKLRNLPPRAPHHTLGCVVQREHVRSAGVPRRVRDGASDRGRRPRAALLPLIQRDGADDSSPAYSRRPGLLPDGCRERSLGFYVSDGRSNQSRRTITCRSRPTSGYP
jgi:hypothetical protein